MPESTAERTPQSALIRLHDEMLKVLGSAGKLLEQRLAEAGLKALEQPNHVLI